VFTFAPQSCADVRLSAAAAVPPTRRKRTVEEMRDFATDRLPAPLRIHTIVHTGVTVNALLPGGAVLTGMIPAQASSKVRNALLDPAIMVPPLLWLVSTESDGMTGQRFVATRWRSDCSGREAAEAAKERAGWPS